MCTTIYLHTKSHELGSSGWKVNVIKANAKWFVYFMAMSLAEIT
jgi:hypothetical protein